MKRWYGKQAVLPRKIHGRHWTPGIYELQVSVWKTKFFRKYRWSVECNIPRKDHPLSGRHLVDKGETWTKAGAWMAAGNVWRETSCAPLAVRRAQLEAEIVEGGG